MVDNTDPDGFDRTFAALDGRLGRTLVIVLLAHAITVITTLRG